MGADELQVDLFLQNMDVFSGGIERTMRLVEFSPHAGIRYTAHLPPTGIPNAEIRTHVEGLRARDLLEVHDPRRNGRRTRANGGGDLVAVPTEYWWPAWRRVRAAGLPGPYCFDFHQLPYLGTLDLLKAVRVDRPTALDLVRVPGVQRRLYGDGLALSTFQALACLASVRAFTLLKDGHILAITPVVAENLVSLGYGGTLHVPETPNGIAADPVEKAMAGDEPVQYDGVYVGRFHPHKGYVDLPRVVAHLKDRLGRDLRIAVCGSVTFRRHQARFARLARELGVERDLVVLGRLDRDELYRTIRRSKMLLYPSYVDGFSLTVLESLCLGVPVVAYNIGALDLIWSRKAAVYRSPVGDPAALAGVAAGLHEDGTWEAARAAALRQAPGLLEEFSWERVVRDQRRFYERAIEEGGRAS